MHVGMYVCMQICSYLCMYACMCMHPYALHTIGVENRLRSLSTGRRCVVMTTMTVLPGVVILADVLHLRRREKVEVAVIVIAGMLRNLDSS